MTAPKISSDDDLLRGMLSGDEEAFASLYRRYQGSIYRFALQMSGSTAAAEDITQEVFLALIRQAGRYDVARGSLASYLYGMARNQILRNLRQNRPHVPLDDNTEKIPALTDLTADLVRSETVHSMRRALLSLPDHYREALVLCDLHAMSYQEAASVIGCSVGTIRSRLSRGRALLGEKVRPAVHEMAAPKKRSQ